MKINISLVIIALLLFGCKSQKGEYVCKPCDQECDLLAFTKPGICPHCKMDLIPKSEAPTFEDMITKNIQIKMGSGNFVIEDSKNQKKRAIKVFYHKPENFKPDSKILMVIPGAGRNGDSYRDAWIEESEKYGVLVVALQYPEIYYAFEEYHLGGLITNPNLQESITYSENSNQVHLDEDNFNFEINTNSETWIFNDFDRIFDLVVHATNSNQTQYDIFGHSAGGQILHRLALFYPNNKANYILAANAGFYTLPDMQSPLPFGVKGSNLVEENLKTSFKNKLVICLGALDNEHETRGTLLRSETVDKQGQGRFSRGHYFFQYSKKLANKMNAQFNWSTYIVPNSGHDHQKMGNAVGYFLYANTAK
ncbi:heavy metal-binding domain-containing protein [Spongiivirga sp. MCCC 1A20706]|uniref:heavy metal-binding domain-containing protein n=1 Tax=Spongiivirga sp. MCCC 1A20706 TaxID=3160963 RepID=UPI0039776F7E